MRRVVEPELLDSLPATDSRAIRSRLDLRRLNVMMGHAGILARAFRAGLARTSSGTRPIRLVELGAGDGTLLLGVARRLALRGVTAEVTLLDRQEIVSAETRAAFASLGWRVETVGTDVRAWLEQPLPAVNIVIANLFLHHFPDTTLVALLPLAAARTSLFIACEPRRSPLALTAARLVRFIGFNEITRHDAIVSVRAGFAGRELSAFWPTDGKWQSSEQSAGLFSHCFIAQRDG
jgi:hypothetical protein